MSHTFDQSRTYLTTTGYRMYVPNERIYVNSDSDSGGTTMHGETFIEFTRNKRLRAPETRTREGA